MHGNCTGKALKSEPVQSREDGFGGALMRHGLLKAQA